MYPEQGPMAEFAGPPPEPGTKPGTVGVPREANKWVTEWLAMGAGWLGEWVGGGERVRGRVGQVGHATTRTLWVYGEGEKRQSLGEGEGVWMVHWPLSKTPTPAPSQPQPAPNAGRPTRGLEPTGKMNKS